MRGSKGMCVRQETPPPGKIKFLKYAQYNYLKYASVIPSSDKLKYPSDPLESNYGSAHASVPLKVVLTIIKHLTFFFDWNSLH